MPVNFKIQVLTLHFHWESSKTATCINWFTPGLQEQRCYKSVPWIFCVVLKSGTANTIHLISLTFHRFFEKKASTSMCWNLALVLTDAFQEHPCSEDSWTVRKTLLLEQITSREPGDPLKTFRACVTTSSSGSMRRSTHPMKCHCSMVRCPIFHKVTSGLTINLDKISLNTGKSMIIWCMIFPVVMYGCESWPIKKAEHQRIDAFELWCWRRLLRVPWTARGSTQLILKEINP